MYITGANPVQRYVCATLVSDNAGSIPAWRACDKMYDSNEKEIKMLYPHTEEDTSRALEAKARIVAGEGTRADVVCVCQEGIAEELYDDPDSNGPTGLHWIETTSLTSACETEEQLARRGL